MISIKNFVNTDIEVLTKPTSFSGFKTTIYFANVELVDNGDFVVVNSYAEYEAAVSENTSNAINTSVSAYFTNGGTSLCIVPTTGVTLSLEQFKASMYSVAAVVKDYYFVVISSGVNLAANALFNIATFCSDIGWSDADKKTLNTIRACFTTDSISFVTTQNILNTLSVVKYSTQTVDGSLVDVALLVGAYFSQIDPSVGDEINDYNFTPEILGENSFEDLSQADFTSLINTPTNGYYNVICNVANKILNVGGNFCSSNNVSISLDFGTACIEHDLDYASIELLFGKLKLNAEGQAKLIDAIRSQLVKYVDNGFLETDATYTGDTKIATYNGKRYTIIKNGDTLPLGYKVFYVPINAISAADKAAKRFPYIYVALQTVHGARLIQIDGSIL